MDWPWVWQSVLIERPRSNLSRHIFPIPKTVLQFSVQAVQEQIPVKKPQSTNQLEKYSSSVYLSSQLLPPKPFCVIPEATAIITLCNISFNSLSILLAKPLAASLTLSFTGVVFVGRERKPSCHQRCPLFRGINGSCHAFLSSYPFFRAAIPSTTNSLQIHYNCHYKFKLGWLRSFKRQWWWH